MAAKIANVTFELCAMNNLEGARFRCHKSWHLQAKNISRHMLFSSP